MLPVTFCYYFELVFVAVVDDVVDVANLGLR